MRLVLEETTITNCKELARSITEPFSNYYNAKSTTGIERAVCRLMGINGAHSDGVPYANIVVDYLKSTDQLGNGAALWLSNAIVNTGKAPLDLAKQVNSIQDLEKFNFKNESNRSEQGQLVLEDLAKKGFETIKSQLTSREELIQKYPLSQPPFRYVIVATGNIHEDTEQAALAVESGADIIAVIRSTAQSLLDYIPEGITTEGYGGTYATQANFALMRKRLDEISKAKQKYVKLVNYASGLCMAEMAVLGGIERLDMMLSDSMYGILFRDINPIRTFIDQHFARRIQAMAGMIINTGEDNYLTTADAYENAYTVLASQFINYEFATASGLQDEQIGLGNAYELDPKLENNFLIGMADAMLSRQCFPKCPLKYMPPTRYKTGNIFYAHVMDAVFNLISIATDQTIHLTGIHTEAVHSPLAYERTLALQNVDYIFTAAKDFARSFTIAPDGVVNERARQTLGYTHHFLEEINKIGLLEAIEQGYFAHVKRSKEGGRGYEGVFDKSVHYKDIFNYA